MFKHLWFTRSFLQRRLSTTCISFNRALIRHQTFNFFTQSSFQPFLKFRSTLLLSKTNFLNKRSIQDQSKNFVVEELEINDEEIAAITRLKLDAGKTKNVLDNVESLNEKLIQAAQYKLFDEFNVFFTRYIHGQFPFNVNTINSMMLLAAMYQRTDQINGIFDLAKQQNVQPNIITFNYAIRACARSGEENIRFAIELFEKMNKMSILKNESTYVELMNVYGANEEVDEAIKLIAAMVTEGIHPTQLSYVTIVDICLANKQPLSALEVINSLSPEEFQKLDYPLGLYHAIFESAIILDDLKGCRTIFDTLRNFSSFPIDEGTICSTLEIASRAGDVVFIDLLWQYLLNLKLKPSAILFNLRIICYLRARQIHESIIAAVEKIDSGFPLHDSIFQLMVDEFALKIEVLDNAFFYAEDIFRKRGKIPKEILDVITCGCAQSGETDRAFATFNEYSKFNLSPDIKTFNYLLKACAHRWQLESAYLVTKEMEKHGVELNHESFTQLIRCACRGARILDAKEILDKMEQKGIEPDAYHYALVVRACIQYHKNYDVADMYIKQIKHPALQKKLQGELGVEKRNIISAR